MCPGTIRSNVEQNYSRTLHVTFPHVEKGFG